jgi:hypothetical protein
LENLEILGGVTVEGLLRGLGVNRLRSLSSKPLAKPTPPSQSGSPDPGTIINAVTPFGVEMSLPKPDITITSPAGVPEGLQSTASLGGGVGCPASLNFSASAYDATIDD